MNEGNSGTGDTGGNGGPTNWVDSIADPELKGYAQTRGWKDVTSVVDSFRNSEKLLGVPADRLLKLPEKDDSPDWNGVWSKLGKPESPDKYGLKIPESGDPAFAKTASEWFHKLNIPAKSAQGLVDNFFQYQQSIAEEQMKQEQIKSEAELTTLKSEWGADYGKNTEFAKRAVQEFGVTQEQLSSIEAAMGTAAFMKLWHTIGSKIGESQFHEGGGGGGGGGGFGITKEQAIHKIATLKADSLWVDRYLKGDASAKDEMSRLMTIAHGS